MSRGWRSIDAGDAGFLRFALRQCDDGRPTPIVASSLLYRGQPDLSLLVSSQSCQGDGTLGREQTSERLNTGSLRRGQAALERI